MKSLLLVVILCITSFSTPAAIVIEPRPGNVIDPRPGEPDAWRASVLLAPAPASVTNVTLATPPLSVTERPLTLVLELQDTSRILGVPSEPKLPMDTGFGNIDLDLDKTECIQWPSPKEKAAITFRNGDRLSGNVKLDHLALITSFGPVKIPFPLIRRINVIPGGKTSAIAGGLVLYYSFDQQPQGDIVPDLSGHGHDGTLMGARFSPDGKRGGACVISGPTGEIRVAKTDDMLLEDFAVSLWVKRSNRNLTSDGSYISVLFGFNTRPNALLGFQPDGQIFLDGIDSVRQFVPARIIDLEWHHIALSKKDQKMLVFLDAEQVADLNYKVPADFRTGCSIGSVGKNIGYPFMGMIDEVKIFSRPLTLDEVKQLSRPEP